ncbi:MAG: ATP-binding protein [Prevotella sp.]|nr:ATP-binding protein [Prevotella sp.]
MKKSSVNNPFIVGHYESAEYFCDRKEETAFLLHQVRNGRNVALISPRRMGKTDLIHHLFHQQEINEEYHTFFIDLYATSSLSELVYLLGKAIFHTLKSRQRTWLDTFFQVISSFRAGFRLDPMSGEPSFDLSLGDIREPEITLQEIFHYLDTADRPCLVAIDEFQQISQYQEKNVEALLRTYIQQCSNACFIYSGSKNSMMTNMFHSSAKPFYQSAVTMGLSPIAEEVYTDFAQSMFRLRGKQLDRDVAESVYRSFDGCTWFLQMMMNELFAITDKGATCHADVIPTARRNIIHTQEISYRELLARLSVKQKQVLLAISKEGTAQQVTSGKFIRQHNLSSPSSVQSALRALDDNGLVTNDNGSCRIYDHFFAQWLKEQYL